MLARLTKSRLVARAYLPRPVRSSTPERRAASTSARPRRSTRLARSHAPPIRVTWLIRSMRAALAPGADPALAASRAVDQQPPSGPVDVNRLPSAVCRLPSAVLTGSVVAPGHANVSRVADVAVVSRRRDIRMSAYEAQGTRGCSGAAPAWYVAAVPVVVPRHANVSGVADVAVLSRKRDIRMSAYEAQGTRGCSGAVTRSARPRRPCRRTQTCECVRCGWSADHPSHLRHSQVLASWPPGHPATSTRPPAPGHRTPATQHPGHPAPRPPSTPATQHPGHPAPRPPSTPATQHPGHPAPRPAHQPRRPTRTDPRCRPRWRARRGR